MFVGDETNSPSEIVHYRQFMSNPGRCLKERKLSAPAAALDLIREMTRPEPSKRMTLEEVQEHPWFDKN